MPLNIERVRNNLLDDAAEDYMGLHEIVWDLANDGGSEAERIAAARSILTEVLAHHDGRLYRSDSWPPREFVPVQREHWKTIIERDNSFLVPPDSEPAVLYWVAIDA